MRIIGVIPQAAKVRMDEFISDDEEIKIVWAESDVVYVVLITHGTHLRGYRFFLISDEWVVSVDYSGQGE